MLEFAPPLAHRVGHAAIRVRTGLPGPTDAERSEAPPTLTAIYRHPAPTGRYVYAP